jgi:hypothetical protein
MIHLLILFALLVASPALAECWSTGTTIKLTATPATGPVASYRAVLEPGDYPAAGETLPLVYTCNPGDVTTVKVQAIGTDGTEGPWSEPSAPIRCHNPGSDMNGDGVVDTRDIALFRADITDGCFGPRP